VNKTAAAAKISKLYVLLHAYSRTIVASSCASTKRFQ